MTRSFIRSGLLLVVVSMFAGGKTALAAQPRTAVLVGPTLAVFDWTASEMREVYRPSASLGCWIQLSRRPRDSESPADWAVLWPVATISVSYGIAFGRPIVYNNGYRVIATGAWSGAVGRMGGAASGWSITTSSGRLESLRVGGASPALSLFENRLQLVGCLELLIGWETFSASIAYGDGSREDLRRTAVSRWSPAIGPEVRFTLGTVGKWGFQAAARIDLAIADYGVDRGGDIAYLNTSRFGVSIAASRIVGRRAGA